MTPCYCSAAYLGDGSKSAATDQHLKIFNTFQAWVKKNFPHPKHRFYIWAEAGMTPGFAAECVILAPIPQDMDLIWVSQENQTGLSHALTFAGC